MILMYKLVVKLDGIKPELSRTIYVPEDILFSELDDILRKVFSLSYFHLSIFRFPGLNTPIWDYQKTYPNGPAMDMNDLNISDYFTLFKKFSWTYNLNKSYDFTISIRKADRKLARSYPFVDSYRGEYDPLEDVSFYDFDEMHFYTIKGMEWPEWLPDFEMEKFNIDEVNRKLMGYKK